MRTRSGKIVIIESKGDHLANEETLARLHLGRAWQEQAGPGYRYFLVFQDKDICNYATYNTEKHPFFYFIASTRGKDSLSSFPLSPHPARAVWAPMETFWAGFRCRI